MSPVRSGSKIPSEFVVSPEKARRSNVVELRLVGRVLLELHGCWFAWLLLFAINVVVVGCFSHELTGGAMGYDELVGFPEIVSSLVRSGLSGFFRWGSGLWRRGEKEVVLGLPELGSELLVVHIKRIFINQF
ncbi:hypothetical protein KY289_001192 [Solanum tuberosum]|nr:hypothetical protein KY289_001192 [Solanum tuberosum]